MIEKMDLLEICEYSNFVWALTVHSSKMISLCNG